MMMSFQQQRYMAVHEASVEIALHKIHRANCRAQFHHSAFFTIASLDAMFFNCNTQSRYFASACVRRTFILFAACGFILFAVHFIFVRWVTYRGILPGKICPLWASVGLDTKTRIFQYKLLN